MCAIGIATGCPDHAVRDFLDSRYGHHFADDVANGLDQDRTTVTIPVDRLSPRACAVLAEEFHAAEEDALARLFADVYAELTGEALPMPSAEGEEPV